MFSNYLAAALRHLVRSRFYAALSIAGLAVGICVVMLMLLVVRSETGYNRVVRGADRVYVAVSTLKPKQHPADYNTAVSHTLAPALKLRFPQIGAIARLDARNMFLERGAVSARERIYWADPAFFEVAPLPVIAGDLRQALERPDGIVLLPLRGPEVLRPGRPARRHAPARPRPDDDGHGDHRRPAARGRRTSRRRSSRPACSPVQRWRASTGSPSIPGLLPHRLHHLSARLAPGASIEDDPGGMPPIAASQFSRRPPGLEYEIALLRIDEAHLFPA